MTTVSPDRYVRCPACDRILAERAADVYVIRAAGKTWVTRELVAECACGKLVKHPPIAPEQSMA